MPLIHHSVNGYDELLSELRHLEQELTTQHHGRNAQTIFVHFTDTKLPGGLNWCEECAAAETVVNVVLESLDQKLQAVHWITCHVGARDYWYNPNNPFRRDSQLRLDAIPALLCLFRSNCPSGAASSDNGRGAVHWSDEKKMDDVCQIFENEEHFASPKILEKIVLDFVAMCATRNAYAQRG